MNICPACFYLRAVENESGTADNGNGFIPDNFPLLDDERIAHLKAICANTPYTVSIFLFACQNMKGLPLNYCDNLHEEQAEKKVCESNKTKYIFLVVDKPEQEQSENKPKDVPVHFVMFTKSPDIAIISEIVAEVKKTAGWLDMVGSVVQCRVFYSNRHLTDVRIIGSLKNKFDNQCKDQNYRPQFQPITWEDEKNRSLFINAGLPRFTIEIQEVRV